MKQFIIWTEVWSKPEGPYVYNKWQVTKMKIMHRKLNSYFICYEIRTDITTSGTDWIISNIIWVHHMDRNLVQASRSLFVQHMACRKKKIILKKFRFLRLIIRTVGKIIYFKECSSTSHGQKSGPRLKVHIVHVCTTHGKQPRQNMPGKLNLNHCLLWNWNWYQNKLWENIEQIE